MRYQEHLLWDAANVAVGSNADLEGMTATAKRSFACGREENPELWDTSVAYCRNSTAIALSQSASKITSAPIAVIASAGEPDWSNTGTREDRK